MYLFKSQGMPRRGFDTGDQPLTVFTLPAGTQTSDLKMEETSPHLGWGWGIPLSESHAVPQYIHCPPRELAIFHG